MPCESCGVQFSVFKRKKICPDCDRYYCSSCLRRGGGSMCGPCRILSTRPLGRQSLGQLKVRDLQCFLHRQNVSTRGCVEKDDLISLVINHVNSTNYRRRPATNRTTNEFTAAFNSLKGFTSNINGLLNSAFDLRSSETNRANCYNTAHSHVPSNPAQSSVPSTSGHTIGTTTTIPYSQTESSSQRRAMGGQFRTNRTEVPSTMEPNPYRIENIGPTPEVVVSDSSPTDSVESERRDTEDCLEIEDLDDAAEWEFVRKPAESLPTDSELLITEQPDIARPVRSQEATQPARRQSINDQSNRQAPAEEQTSNTHIVIEEHPIESHSRESAIEEVTIPEYSSSDLPHLSPTYQSQALPSRASSELNLHRTGSDDTVTDTSSLRDEPFVSEDSGRSPKRILLSNESPRRIQLNDLKNLSDVEMLNVKQLKELLTLNRVDYKGCVERKELMERAKRLWKESNKSREDINSMSIDECCKICMDAPLECVLLECGHIATCTDCGKRLSECPICRQYVVRCVRFFRS